MTEDAILSDVVTRCALTREGARAALHATLRSLGDSLDEHASLALRTRLPPSARPSLGRGVGSRDFDVHAFVRGVARRLDVTPGVALEHAQVVAAAIARTMDPDAATALRAQLPPDAEALFTPTTRPPPTPYAAPTSDDSSLATGRPGSRTPIADAAAEAARPHRGSVAISADPGGERKLSGAEGYDAERSGDTLARGKPGAKHPVSGSG